MLSAGAYKDVERLLTKLYAVRDLHLEMYASGSGCASFEKLKQAQAEIRLLEEIADDAPLGGHDDGNEFPPISDGHVQAIVMSKLGSIGLTMHDLRNFLAGSCGHSPEQARERVLHYVNTGEFNFA